MNQDIDRLKKAILNEYPRMDEHSPFQFKCHPDVPCFNDCCSDITIFLTPYDVVRLKNRLGITSSEFIDKYAIVPFDKNSPYPVVVLKMQSNERKTCHFVSDIGCTVYEDRPWACRMYPLGLASPKDGEKGDLDKEFFFLLKDSDCKGHLEDHQYTVGEWIGDQGIEQYSEIGELFKDITLHDYFKKNQQLTPQAMDMFFTACYDIDKFKKFVFESSFLQKFDVDDETVERITNDDVELLKFGFQWIRFALFREPTLQIKTDVATAKQAEMKKETEKKQSDPHGPRL